MTDSPSADTDPTNVRPAAALDAPQIASAAADSAPVDLDAIEAELHDVESALARLADGTYFADRTDHDAGHDTAHDTGAD